MAQTLCLSGAVVLKAGTGVSSTIATDTNLNTLINMAEGQICANAKRDFVTLSSSTCAIGKEFLKDVCSSLAAIYAINYDMSGYTSRTEAQTMLDINWNTVREGLNLLRDNNFVSFVVLGTSAE